MIKALYRSPTNIILKTQYQTESKLNWHNTKPNGFFSVNLLLLLPPPPLTDLTRPADLTPQHHNGYAKW